MKKLCVVGVLALLMCGAWGGVSDAARSGGTLNFIAPYGGDLLGLDAHKSTRVQDFLVMSNINRSLYSWEPGVNKPKLELATKVDVSADGKVWTFKLR
ncbi:MAG: ABC transporter substrate-binding protein, partial [Zetaproteobacteria bacterium]